MIRNLLLISFVFFAVTSKIVKAQNTMTQKIENNFSYSQYTQIINPNASLSVNENVLSNGLLNFGLSALDTSQIVLKYKKIARKYYFIYDNQAPKLMYFKGDFSPEFKSIIKTNPEAQTEFNKSRYYGFAAIVGDVAFTAFTIKEFAHTVSEVNQVNNNTLPNTGFKFGDFVPMILSAAFTVTFSLESRYHFNQGFEIFNTTKTE